MSRASRFLAPAAFAFLLAPTASATDYRTPAQLLAEIETSPSAPDDAPAPVLAFAPSDPVAQLSDVARFLAGLQVTTLGSPDRGGIREGEILGEIVQSDNTHEAIWVWSRHEELTGDRTYRPNVEAAWSYLAAHPAFEEEGGSGPDGYYRVYNCGWALRAEPTYRRVTHDTSHLDYAFVCAQYLIDGPLDTEHSEIAALNAMDEAWAAANLFAFGTDVDSPALREAAGEIGERAKAWVDVDPNRLSLVFWALSGGTAFWGIVESYFRVHPEEARSWIATHSSYLSVRHNRVMWDNAHDAWNALAHWTAFRALASPEHARTARDFVDTLLALDADGDGGIPSSSVNGSTADESWVSSYLAFMGLERRLPTVQVAAAAHASSVERGGSLDVDVAALQWTAAPLRVVGSTLGFDSARRLTPGNPLLGPAALTLLPSRPVAASLHFRVPARAPSGAYTLVFRIQQPGGVARARLPFVVR